MANQAVRLVKGRGYLVAAQFVLNLGNFNNRALGASSESADLTGFSQA